MRPALVVLVTALAGCGGTSARPSDTPATRTGCAPTSGEAERAAPAPPGTSARVRLGPGEAVERTPATLAAARRGRPLVVRGVVSGTDCSPLDGATIHAWQANGRGEYGPYDRCCYLQGTARTASNGRYVLDTVAPGGYGGGVAHIHVEASHPAAEGIVTEIVFTHRPGSHTRFDIVLRRR